VTRFGASVIAAGVGLVAAVVVAAAEGAVPQVVPEPQAAARAAVLTAEVLEAELLAFPPA
jgi:hypothetical protein